MFKIGNKLIGDKKPCYFVFEAGPTHNGFRSAKKLIKIAANAGADAIKFQIFDPERLMHDKKQLISFDVFDKKKGSVRISEPLYDIIKRRSLKKSQWKKLKNYSDSLGICFFATVGFNDEIEFLEEIKCHSIKIASADVNHLPLIQRAAKSKMNIQLDTGNASIDEIKTAIEVINKENNDNIVIHHCPSGYPAKSENVNLNILKTLKREFPYPIAFSDHSPGLSMGIAAIALGVNMIEKTITESKKIKRIEHFMSLEEKDTKIYVKELKQIEKALGVYEKKLSKTEIKNISKIRRAAYLKNNHKKNDIIDFNSVIFKRPGYGIGPEFFYTNNFKLKKNIKKNQIIKKNDVIQIPRYSAKTSKIGIGTAQFGSKYGVNNLYGESNYKTIKQILDTGLKNNITTLDLAENYGSSLPKLKKYFKYSKFNNWNICFKVSSSFNSIFDKFNEITEYIGIKPKTIMFHRANTLLYFKDLKSLMKLKQSENINIGCSLYDEEDLYSLINAKIPIDVIQVPMNLIDKRFNSKKIINLLKKNNIKVYARSIFLQGLFFMPEDKIQKKFPNMDLFKEIYSHKYLKMYKLHQLSLHWALNCQNIDKIILGFEINNQLKEILHFIKKSEIDKKIYNTLNKISISDKSILIPSFWNTD